MTGSLTSDMFGTRCAPEHVSVLVVMNEQLQKMDQSLRSKDSTIEDLNTLLVRRKADVDRLTAQLRSVTSSQPKSGLTLPQLAARASMVATLKRQLDESIRENDRLKILAGKAEASQKLVCALKVRFS